MAPQSTSLRALVLLRSITFAHRGTRTKCLCGFGSAHRMLVRSLLLHVLCGVTRNEHWFGRTVKAAHDTGVPQ